MAPWARRGLAAAGLAAGALVLAVAIGAPRGLFAGSRPADLGLVDGRLRGGDWRPNWVSSQVPRTDDHFAEPLPAAGEGSWPALVAAVRAEPGARVVASREGYLHAEFVSPRLGFVDDAEFARDAAGGVIHFRAGARLGIRDFGVNRARIERLRAALAPKRS